MNVDLLSAPPVASQAAETDNKCRQLVANKGCPHHNAYMQVMKNSKESNVRPTHLPATSQARFRHLTVRMRFTRHTVSPQPPLHFLSQGCNDGMEPLDLEDLNRLSIGSRMDAPTDGASGAAGGAGQWDSEDRADLPQVESRKQQLGGAGGPRSQFGKAKYMAGPCSYYMTRQWAQVWRGGAKSSPVSPPLWPCQGQTTGHRSLCPPRSALHTLAGGAEPVSAGLSRTHLHVRLPVRPQQADIIFVPYNYILDDTVRATLTGVTWRAAPSHRATHRTTPLLDSMTKAQSAVTMPGSFIELLSLRLSKRPHCDQGHILAKV